MARVGLTGLCGGRGSRLRHDIPKGRGHCCFRQRDCVRLTAVPATRFLHVTPLWVCRYGSAVVVGASIAVDRNSWDQGFFVTAAEDIAPWLGIVVVVAAVVSNVGIYQASLATTGRALWAMAGGAPDEVPDAMVVSNVGAACCNPV